MTLRDAIRSEMLTLVIEQNADLRDRLRVLAEHVCEGCGCAVKCESYTGGMMPLCSDCINAECPDVVEPNEHAGACISVGMRALCGRRILEGC